MVPTRSLDIDGCATQDTAIIQMLSSSDIRGVWLHVKLSIFVIAWAVMASACGSTVRATGQQALAGGPSAAAGPAAGIAEDSLGGGGAGVQPGPPITGAAAPGGGGGGGSGAPPTAAGGASPSAGSAASQGGAAAPDAAGGQAGGPSSDGGVQPAPADAPGAPEPAGQPILAAHRAVTDATIKVGFLYLGNAGTVVSAFGAGEAYSQGDEPAEFQAIVDDVNARGGVAGRQLEIVFHDLGGIDETAYQAACTKFTEDDPVFMVFSGLGHYPLYTRCLAEGDVGFSSSYVGPPEALVEETRGLLWAPDELTSDKHWALTITALLDAGWFDGATIGIEWPDDPYETDVLRRIVEPLLASAGHEVAHEERYPSTDPAAAVSGIAGRLFRMRANGVTHIVSFLGPALAGGVAESQGYRPKWVVTSRMGPNFIAGTAPAAQLEGSSGPGWSPVLDFGGDAQLQGLGANAARCDQVLRDAGVHPGNDVPLYVGRMICGAVYHFADALAVAPEVSSQGFRTAAESLGPRDSTLAYQIDHSGGRHDGVSAYRLLTFDAGCACYGYADDLRRAEFASN
jgi:hypothetical protein